MVKLKNIHPLSDFVRNAKTHLGKLKKSGEPAVLTVNGEAEAVVLSAEAYEKMMEEIETLENLNAIHKGMVQAQRGEGIPASELIRRLKEGPKRQKSA